MTELTIDQQCQIAVFKRQVQKMSREQAQEMLIKLFEDNLLQRVTFTEMLGHHWGMLGSETE
jgi:hypothetical protein